MSARQVALGGVLTALAVTILTLGSLIPMATFCAPLLAMAALLPVLEECGRPAAGGAWAAVSLLGMLLAADREAALVYVFFGWYPAARPTLERISPAILRLGAKLAVFCGALALCWGAAAWLLGVPEEAQAPWLPAALGVMAVATFLLADRLIGRLTLLWRRKFRRRFFP